MSGRLDVKQAMATGALLIEEPREMLALTMHVFAAPAADGPAGGSGGYPDP